MVGARCEQEVMAAGRLLFGPEVTVTREFLAILQPSGVKAAFRSRARETHPDMHMANPSSNCPPGVSFHDVTAAYDQLIRYCQRRMVRSQSAEKAAPGAGRGSSRKGPRTSIFYAGDIPPRTLLFGRFLYYSRLIPYHLLLSAIAWQRQQRPVIGQLANRWGWLQAEEVQQVLLSAFISGRFGEKAQQLNLLTARQVSLLLTCQRQRQRRLGDFFVEHGHLSRRQVESAVHALAEHNARIAHL